MTDYEWTENLDLTAPLGIQPKDQRRETMGQWHVINIKWAEWEKQG